MAKMNIRQASIGNQRPGYSPKAYIGLVSEMLVIPAAVAGVVTADITFNADPVGLGFMEVYGLPKRGAGASNTVGEAGGLSDNYSHTLFIPGNTAAVDDFLKTIQNKELIVLAQDAEQAGPVWQYGTEQNPAYIDAKTFESGTMADGTKGTLVTIFAIEKYQYSGDITVYTP